MNISRSVIRTILFLLTATILVIEPYVQISKDYEAYMRAATGDFAGCQFNIYEAIHTAVIGYGALIAFTLLARDIFSKVLVLVISVGLLTSTILEESSYWDVQHCGELLFGGFILKGGIILAIVGICSFSFIVHIGIKIYKFIAGKMVKRQCYMQPNKSLKDAP